MHTVPGAFEALVKLYAEGERLLEIAAFADAERTFSDGLAIDDHFRQRYVTMYAQRAFARQHLGHFADAAEDYGRALSMEPPLHHGQYHLQRGMCLSKLAGRADEALADFDRAIALNPEQPGPYHLRGKLLIEEKDELERGIADLDQVARLRPHPQAFQLRAYANSALGRHEAALSDARAAEALRSDAYNHYLMATALVHLHRDDEAYRAISATLERDPSFQDTFATDAEFDRLRDQPEFARLIRKA